MYRAHQISRDLTVSNDYARLNYGTCTENKIELVSKKAKNVHGKRDFINDYNLYGQKLKSNASLNFSYSG